MLKLYIFLLSFLSVLLFFTQLLPYLSEKFAFFQQKKFDNTVEQLDKMFIDVEREKYFPFFAASPIILGIVAMAYFQTVLAAVAGVAVGIVLPPFVVQFVEKQRRKKFQNQLTDALLIMSSSLKSGLSLMQAMEVVIEEMPIPVSQEFKLVLHATKIGIPMERAMERLNRRMYSEELEMVITAILVTRETGGDLSKIFGRLVYTIRQKNKIKAMVNNLTIQARWQGVIMMFLPIFFGVSVYRMNPDFFVKMLRSEIGRGLLIYAVVSQVVGMYIIKRLSKVEV